MPHRRRLLISTPLLLLALLVQPAAAGRLWCKADPVVSLDHRLVSISVAIPAESLLAVSGPTSITIQAPPSVSHALVVNDLGFMGYGTIVTFVDGGGPVKDDAFPVEVSVSVPVAAAEPVPMQVTVLPDNQLPVTVEGTVDRTVVRLTVKGR
jgi:hypothetical protein